jgi:hypothetical protein
MAQAAIPKETGGHWCFNHEKFMVRELLERTCKPKGHDIDFEDLYTPPSRMKTPEKKKNIDAVMEHAQLVTDIADNMFEKTHLVYIQSEDVFYYWNYRKNVWEPQGNSFLMKLFNEITPRVIPNKKRLFSDVIFQIKLDAVIPPKLFVPDPNYLYFNNCALDLEMLDDHVKHKDHYIQVCLDTEIDLRAPPPKIFLDALAVALPNSLELYDCLRWLITCLGRILHMLICLIFKRMDFQRLHWLTS